MGDVTICICTFRRESIAATLRSIAEATAYAPVPVVVIDNDDHNGARDRILAAAAAAKVAATYVHAPARNISIARNAALDAVETRWAAFIDDDEIAEPAWLCALLLMRDRGEAIIGQSRALYDPGVPAWNAACDFHSNRLEGRADNAYTSNALIDVDFVRRHDLRFRLDLGQTGGEDTLFFRAFSEAGGRILYQPDSVVVEPVSTARATMRWALRRRFRAGQTHGLVLQQFDRKAYRILLVTAAAKCVFSLIAAAATVPGTTASRKWLARSALHAGSVSYRLYPRIVREYAS